MAIERQPPSRQARSNRAGSAGACGFVVAAAVVAWQLGAGCAYVGTAIRQAGYALGQPEQRVFKHMLARDTFYVFGVLHAGARVNPDAIAVIAVSDRFRKGEVVDVNHCARVDSFYGLNLPDGDYRLLVVSDLNRDGYYDELETIGIREVSLQVAEFPERVRSGVDIDAPGKVEGVGTAFRIAVEKIPTASESLFYPKGSIRSFDDPIFSRSMAELGIYEPAAFLERAPMMFYALEEDLGYKVPVVFVHGIGGSARDFQPIVAQLDRQRYRPWFFHYASGSDLGQLGEMFHRLFLSGKTIPLDRMPLVIVAHSMGGLVVREALNRRSGKTTENTVGLLVTIATPFGGHPGAGSGARAPVVIPSWLDLDPESAFLRGLHRKPLPAGLNYQLLYAFGDDRALKFGESSDGVVPLWSQLAPPAQKEATAQYGFNATHAGVLGDPALIARVLAELATVKPPFPDDHLRELWKGGYADLGANYTAREKYYLANFGHYMDALVAGELAPIDPSQVQFNKACRGEKHPGNEAAAAWVKFNREFPQRDRSR